MQKLRQQKEPHGHNESGNKGIKATPLANSTADLRIPSRCIKIISQSMLSLGIQGKITDLS